jgi:hypothetical protein
MEATPEVEGESRRFESCGGVLGIGLGLVLIVVCAATVALYGPRRLDARELLSRSFELGTLPAGLVLESEAVALPGGEQVVTFGDGSPLSISPTELLTESSAGKQDSQEEFAEYDWQSVESLSEETLPARLFLVRFPRSRAERVLASQFRGLEWRDLSEIPSKGGATVVGGGKLPWAGYEADWVRERRFIEGGSFRDTLRVNLSLGQECWIAYAIWPERAAGAEQVVGRCLVALTPRAQSLDD